MAPAAVQKSNGQHLGVLSEFHTPGLSGQACPPTPLQHSELKSLGVCHSLLKSYWIMRICKERNAPELVYSSWTGALALQHPGQTYTAGKTNRLFHRHRAAERSKPQSSKQHHVLRSKGLCSWQQQFFLKASSRHSEGCCVCRGCLCPSTQLSWSPLTSDTFSTPKPTFL